MGAGGRATHVQVIEIGFEPEQPSAELPIVASLDTPGEAGPLDLLLASGVDDSDVGGAE